ncbi:MAG: radical SAM protein [Nanoarchaeota archaeon]|nr:radical SAM protein [Nanoarchaeota archaeon]MBU1632601.1 radical SAM protein [Nanoarchaeota archaeon]
MKKINEFNAFEKVFKYSDKLNYFFNRHKTLISLELDLTNLCNNNCPNCTGIKENPVSLSFEQIKKLVDEFADVIEAKSIIISGGGEPLIHPDFVKTLYYIKNKGLKIGLNSNGLSLNEEKAKAIIECCSYFRISLDAGTPEVYKKTHGMNESAFFKVLENIKMFSILKKELNGNVAFGTGFLTSEMTKPDINNFFRVSKESRVDFAQLRPFTGDYTKVNEEFKKAKEIYEDEKFKVTASVHKYACFDDENKRSYRRCLGMFFNTVVTADFKVFACLHHRQKDKYFIGDLNKNTLKELWTSSRIIDVFNSIDCVECPYFCRNDDINRSLEFIDKEINHKEFL